MEILRNDLSQFSNPSISEIANDDVQYALPHEYLALQNELEEIETHMKSLSDLNHSAMNESSETFHDNAPAEALRDESIVYSSRNRSLLSILEKIQIIDYPSEELNFITIGSLVSLQFENGDTEQFYIAGVVNYSKINDPEVTLCSYKSPVGKLLVGRNVGNKILLDSNKQTVTILSIRQIGKDSPLIYNN